jgi:hypothetical protein
VPAEAAGNANVYIAYPTFDGSCPNGGKVTGIWAANGNIWSTPSGGDWGDDLIYPRVNLYTWNQISAQPYCSRPWYDGGGYYGVPSSVSIYPTRNGMTFWVGPLGQSHN